MCVFLLVRGPSSLRSHPFWRCWIQNNTRSFPQAFSGLSYVLPSFVICPEGHQGPVSPRLDHRTLASSGVAYLPVPRTLSVGVATQAGPSGTPWQWTRRGETQLRKAGAFGALALDDWTQNWGPWLGWGGDSVMTAYCQGCGASLEDPLYLSTEMAMGEGAGEPRGQDAHPTPPPAEAQRGAEAERAQKEKGKQEFPLLPDGFVFLSVCKCSL